MGHFSDQYIDDCDRRSTDDDAHDLRDGVSSKPTIQPTYTKTITPAYHVIGRRKKLTGYIGQLHNGETVIHSKEYSTYHEAEVALDALVFELLHALAEQGLVDELPSFEPTTCVFCHKPHHPQHCSEKNARLFAPERCACGAAVKWEVGFETEPLREYFCGVCYSKTGYFGNRVSTQCAYRGCIQNRTHDDTGFCCYHNEEETGCRCDCEDDDYADAMAEQAMGTYNGEVPADFVPLDVDFAPVGPEV